MTWADLSAEIAEEFAELDGHVEWRGFRVVHTDKFDVFREREQTDPAFRARCSENRERRRRERMAADPAYAARAKAIAKAAYERRKERLRNDPVLRAHQRANWRKYKARQCGQRWADGSSAPLESQVGG